MKDLSSVTSAVPAEPVKPLIQVRDFHRSGVYSLR